MPNFDGIKFNLLFFNGNHRPDDHDGVITHPETGILECEVKWVLESITMNKATLATSCQELTHWKRLWCWEGLGAGGEGDNRGWDGWMASPTRWTWVWVNSGSWWWTERPGILQVMGLQRVVHDWVTALNWTELNLYPTLNPNSTTTKVIPFGRFYPIHIKRSCFLVGSY